MISSSEDDDIIFELYKLSFVILPEQNIWSIKEISKRLIIELKLTKEAEIVKRLKKF